MKSSIRNFLSVTPSNGLAPNAGFLRANSEAYEWLVGKIQKMDLRREAEAVLRRLAFAAQFAAKFHSGRFADGAIENLAFKIGSELDELLAEYGGFVYLGARKESRRRVLHVASFVLFQTIGQGEVCDALFEPETINSGQRVAKSFRGVQNFL